MSRDRSEQGPAGRPLPPRLDPRAGRPTRSRGDSGRDAERPADRAAERPADRARDAAPEGAP
ncbi:hypothetical protein, partial [Geodermatophilus sp. CPCC 206100]|uniref:hypothetical protein n=1 Tax=Geodermatophilus sp. CPCC 206100 TaxID=3020054 RepID=UPI003B003A75